MLYEVKEKQKFDKCLKYTFSLLFTFSNSKTVTLFFIFTGEQTVEGEQQQVEQTAE